MRSNTSLEGVVLEGSPAARNPNKNLYKNPKLLFVFVKQIFCAWSRKAPPEYLPMTLSSVKVDQAPVP